MATLRVRPRGLFVTFEGPEGSGKSTQMRLLKRYLEARGRSVVCLREPGGTVIGERIRRLVLDPRWKAMSANCELFLYLASRAQLVDQVIRPALRAGKIVVCDRFHDATVCYQGYGQGVPLGVIRTMGAVATEHLRPDVTFLLDVGVERGLRRAGGRDRIERKSRAFHRRVRAGYLRWAKAHRRRFRVVPVGLGIQAVHHEVRTVVERLWVAQRHRPRG